MIVSNQKQIHNKNQEAHAKRPILRTMPSPVDTYKNSQHGINIKKKTTKRSNEFSKCSQYKTTFIGCRPKKTSANAPRLRSTVSGKVKSVTVGFVHLRNFTNRLIVCPLFIFSTAIELSVKYCSRLKRTSSLCGFARNLSASYTRRELTMSLDSLLPLFLTGNETNDRVGILCESCWIRVIY